MTHLMDWYPLNTRTRPRPNPGQLIAHQHAVWEVKAVDDLPIFVGDLEGDARDLWLAAGAPDLTTWPLRPYRVHLRWVGGAGSTQLQWIDVPAGTHKTWHVYPTHRWPRCSCCGEPTPCRAELEDRQISAALNRIARLEAIPVGACWACAKPITPRQKWVTYPGGNLDLPGGQQPRFHLRSDCRWQAKRYEERWLAEDPRRERILTYPRCDGILLVHSDGSSECVSGHTPLGNYVTRAPDCRGHDTHDHGTVAACYAPENGYFAKEWTARCSRGCDPRTHEARATPRPRRERPLPPQTYPS